jgi:hypothetical protein
MFPQARLEKLSVQQVPHGTMVFDLQSNKYHSLNRTAALVWKHCDGRTSEAELAQIVHHELGLPADEGIVRLALEQLERRRLLETPLEPWAIARRRSRRDMLRKLAVAAVALPVVMTATAKPAVAATSPPHITAGSACAGQTSGVTPACITFCGGNDTNARCDLGMCLC